MKKTVDNIRPLRNKEKNYINQDFFQSQNDGKEKPERRDIDCSQQSKPLNLRI